ncbi:MAG: hypothetical protein AAB538_06170, partial [Patescibacteria group bacterium]
GWRVQPWAENGIVYAVGNDGYLYKYTNDGFIRVTTDVQTKEDQVQPEVEVQGLPPDQIGPDDVTWVQLGNGQVANRVTHEIFVQDPTVPGGWRVIGQDYTDENTVPVNEAQGNGMPPGGWNVAPYREADGSWTATGADGKKYNFVNGKWQVNEYTPPAVGETFVNPNDGKTYKWDGTTWVEVQSADGGTASTIHTTRSQDEIKAMLDQLYARANDTTGNDISGAAPPGQDFSLNLPEGQTDYSALIDQLFNKSAFTQSNLSLPRADIQSILDRLNATAEKAGQAGANLPTVDFSATSGSQMADTRGMLYDAISKLVGADVALPAGANTLNETSTKALTDVINQGYTGISEDLFGRLYESAMRPYNIDYEKNLDRLREDAQKRGVFYSGYLSKDQDDELRKLLTVGADTAADLALTSQQLGQDRFNSAIASALGLSDTMGRQQRDIGAEQIARTGAGSDFLTAREGAALGAAGENRATEALKLQGAQTQADIFDRVAGNTLQQTQVNIDAMLAEDQALSEREQLNLNRLAQLEIALNSQDVNQRANAELELQRVEAEQSELRARRDEIRANADLELRQKQRIDDLLGNAVGQEVGYNLGEQAMINQEYNSEWQRQFTRLITDFDLNAQLRAEDLNTVNAILQVLYPGLQARAGDTLLQVLQQGINSYAAQGV